MNGKMNWEDIFPNEEIHEKKEKFEKKFNILRHQSEKYKSKLYQDST